MFTRIGLSHLFTTRKSLRNPDDNRQDSPLILKLLQELRVSGLIIDLGDASTVINLPHMEHLTRQQIKIGSSTPSIYENMRLLDIYNPACMVKITHKGEGVKEALTMGAWVIAMMDAGESESEQLQKSAAHYKITTLQDIPAIIADINAQLSQGTLPHASMPRFMANCSPMSAQNEDTPLITFPS